MYALIYLDINSFIVSLGWNWNFETWQPIEIKVTALCKIYRRCFKPYDSIPKGTFLDYTALELE